MSAKTKPNVMLFCADHYPGKLMRCAGDPDIMTPTLDQMAANGVRFSECYSQTPTCIPARRALMTGTTAKTHGDRVFKGTNPMPDLKTMPQVFRDNGYQAYAVGKLHVHPQRSRIGFDDVILCEEGRLHGNNKYDDYEMFLKKEGYPGQQFTHAMSNNEYYTRPWHLPERCHPTNWCVREMCETIKRRDTEKPGFWYCSFQAPHPPLAPIRDYLEMYKKRGISKPLKGKWAEKLEDLPYPLKLNRLTRMFWGDDEMLEQARMAFYAQCTYIDHQMRLVIATLKEEGILGNTILMFTSDHGDMLGNHALFAKPPMLEGSAKIPLILVPTSEYKECGHNVVDNRFAGLRDIMPTLLDMCGLEIPESVEGVSLVSNNKRDHIYCEHFEDKKASRMIRWKNFKLIWYPAGNCFQMFDLAKDPDEMHEISENKENAEALAEMKTILRSELYGTDLEKWVDGDQLTGEAEEPIKLEPNRALSGQRGWR